MIIMVANTIHMEKWKMLDDKSNDQMITIERVICVSFLEISLAKIHKAVPCCLHSIGLLKYQVGRNGAWVDGWHWHWPSDDNDDENNDDKE